MGCGPARRARAAIGARFRPQGRDAAQGLDCIGLAAIAYRIADVPRDYALRGGCRRRIERALADLGFERVDGEAAGEGCLLLLLRAGVEQLHLAVRTEGGFVHADAALRRVVERPLPAPWPVLSAWHLPTGD